MPVFSSPHGIQEFSWTAVMVSDAQLTPDWRNGFGGRTAAAATPFLGWKRRGGDSAGEAVAPLSARKLAASLWRLGGGSVRWQCGLSFDRLGFQFCSSLPIPKFATEEATKAWDCADYFESNVKLTSSAAFSGQAELFKSRKHVNEREAEGGGSMTKIKYRTRKIDEERASSMRTEQQRRMCSVIKNLAEGIRSERKNCKNMDKMNSNMLRDIGEAKLSARKLIWNLEKEKKARKELEGACYDLANEIKGRKAEIGALRNEQRRIREEAEEERKMREMAEVWREERAQMKLADAKLILEDKYAEINEVMADVVGRSNLSADVNVVRQLGFGVKELKSDEALAVIKDAQTSEAERSHCDATTKTSVETVTQAEIYSSEGSGSVNKIRRGYNVSNCNAAESKRNEGRCKTILIDGSSTRNPHVVRGMKGDVEWPCRIQRHALPPANLLEAKFQSQKVLLRNLLKHNT